MRVVNGKGQGSHQLGCDAGGLGLPLQTIGQRASLNEFQREERLAFMFTDLKDLGDIGMLKLGSSRGLSLEPRKLLGVGVSGSEDDLECDEAIQRFLSRPIDDAHASATEFLKNLVARRGKVRWRGARGRLPAGMREGWDLAYRAGIERRTVGAGRHLLDYLCGSPRKEVSGGADFY
jgi:hypothetical protein